MRNSGLFEKSIEVYASYEFEEPMPGLVVISGQFYHKNPFKYNPWEKMPEILKDCGKINVSLRRSEEQERRESILTFCNKWGTFKPRFKANDDRNDIEQKPRQYDETTGERIFYGQEINDFIETAAGIQKVANYLKVDEWWKRSSDRYVRFIVNNLLDSMSLSLSINNGDFKPLYDYSGLGQAIGAYFYEKLINREGLRECLRCHKLFTPIPADRKFCPPKDELAKRSECENRYNQQKHRDKVKKKASKEFTLETSLS